ncbi:MAG TPA: hypothetical protein VNY29_15815 [Terriglobales bacterium]|nr:hypothetical protein [Terriglobales bacterium]
MKLMVLLPLLFLPAFGQSTNRPNSSPTHGMTTAAPAGSITNYRAATESDRARWFLNSTLGPSRLFLVGPINAGWGTMRDVPSEYGTHWDGFGKRNGMRLTGVATGNLIEAGLGSAWGEDPRYFRSPAHGFGPRMKYVLKTTFLAPHRDGRWHTAYARFVGNVGNNFLSNTWRADSEAHPSDAVVRCVWGVLGRMTSDAFEEFWPDVEQKVLRRR